MRRTVFEQHPWVAMNLFKMFDEAKRRCFSRLRDFTCARVPLPWAAAIADDIAARCGPETLRIVTGSWVHVPRRSSLDDVGIFGCSRVNLSPAVRGV